MEEQKEENQVKGNKKRYRQKNKKSSPIPKPIMSKPLPSSYVEQKQKEIPMYDPYTGEPNPHYEQLTGKKNPLLENKIDAISNTKNGDNHKIKSGGKDIKVPEFLTRNRFLVKLPKEFKIEPFFITSITGPKINFDTIKLLGINTHITKYTVDDIEIFFKLSFSDKLTKKLFDMGATQDFFDIKVELISPINEVIETWCFDECQIKTIDFGTLQYKDNSILNCKIVFSPSYYRIQ